MARTHSANFFANRRKAPVIAEDATSPAGVAFVGERVTVDGEDSSLLARVSLALAAFALVVGSAGYLML